MLYHVIKQSLVFMNAYVDNKKMFKIFVYPFLKNIYSMHILIILQVTYVTLLHAMFDKFMQYTQRGNKICKRKMNVVFQDIMWQGSNLSREKLDP